MKYLILLLTLLLTGCIKPPFEKFCVDYVNKQSTHPFEVVNQKCSGNVTCVLEEMGDIDKQCQEAYKHYWF